MKFGHIILKDNVIFLKTALSFAFVNIKPIVPGHVLIAPKRCIERLSDLQEEEVKDLFVAAQNVSTVIQKHFGADSMTLAVQDGPEAGQTVKHVHVHVLPRKAGDFEDNDQIYTKLEKHDKEISPDMAAHSCQLRSDAEMAAEATTLRSYFMT